MENSKFLFTHKTFFRIPFFEHTPRLGTIIYKLIFNYNRLFIHFHEKGFASCFSLKPKKTGSNARFPGFKISHSPNRFLFWNTVPLGPPPTEVTIEPRLCRCPITSERLPEGNEERAVRSASRLFRERFDVSEEGWTFLGTARSLVIYFLLDLLTTGCLTRVALRFIPKLNLV